MSGNIPQLTNEEIDQRREYTTQKLRQLHTQFLETNPGHEGTLFYISCPNVTGCSCVGEEIIPKLEIDLCLAPGEFDYFGVTQPFMPDFEVYWRCIHCGHEMCCGCWWYQWH